MSLPSTSMKRGNFKWQPTFAINQFVRKANFPSPLENGPIKVKGVGGGGG